MLQKRSVATLCLLILSMRAARSSPTTETTDCGRYGQEFRCDNGRCVRQNKVCDKFDDCGDRSDERDCDCPSYRFLCGNGRCIYDYQRCDGYDDCNNDEDDCPLSGGAVAILAVTFTIFGIVAFVGALVALCIRLKNRNATSPHQSWPTETAPPVYGPCQMIQVPTYAQAIGLQEQPPSFDEAVSEKRQS